MTNTVEALKVIAEYADQLGQADELNDQGSLKAGEKALELYEDAEVWVDEFIEVKPPKPDATGRVPDPKNPNRFRQWLAWRLEQEGHRPLTTRRTGQIMDGAETAHRLNHGSTNQNLTSERVVRPLNWLVKNGYQDRVPEVWF